jgi:hypothetical protein
MRTRRSAIGPEHLFAMARPSQFQYSETESLVVAKVKATLKEMSPEARAYVMAWLVKFYGDNGMMFSPTITQQRKRVTIDEIEYWLVGLPKR